MRGCDGGTEVERSPCLLDWGSWARFYALV